MNHRITPKNITYVKEDEIFVFGSNESGIHGAGAAYAALSFGAQMGAGFGRMGNTFAIPTKDWKVRTLSFYHIEFYIERFLYYAEIHPELTFLVTPIACGLAGHTPEDIAPYFRDAVKCNNIHLPEEFWNILNQ